MEDIIANVRVLRAEGISVSGGTLFVELAREDGGGAYTTQALPSPCWNETLRLPVGDGLGRVKVSLQAGAPLTEEELVELAFHGEELPSPLGWVTVSLAEVRDLDQTRTFQLQGVTLNDEHHATITLGFTFEEGVAAEAVTSLAALATRPSTSSVSSQKSAGSTPSKVAPTPVGAPQQAFSDDENPDYIGEVRAPAETESCSAREASEISEEFAEADGSSGGSVSDREDDDGTGGLEMSRCSLSPHGPEGGAGQPLELVGAGRRLDGGGMRGNEGEADSDEGREEGEDPGGTAEEESYGNDWAGFGQLAPSFSGPLDEDEGLEGYPMGSDLPALDSASLGGPEECSGRVANLRNVPWRDHTNPFAGDGSDSCSTPLSVPQCAVSGCPVATDDGIAGGDQGGGGGGGRRRRARGSGVTAINGGIGSRTELGRRVLTGGTARDRERSRLESLRATVAVTVAAVAQETLSESLRSGFNGSSSTSETTTSGTSNNPTSRFGTAWTMGLGFPLSGSRSPPPASPLPVRSAASYFEGVASQSVRNRSAERDGVTSSSSDEGFDGSLALAGPRSPAPSFPLRGGRETNSSDGESLDRTRGMGRQRGVAERKGSNTSGSTSGHGFMGSLPLAGSRSPPASPLPGRRSPDAASCYSTSEAKEEEKENVNTNSRSPSQQSLSTAVFPSPTPQASLTTPRAAVSPKRQQRRHKRRSGHQERHRALPQAGTTQMTAAAIAGGPRAEWLFSEASSAPLDLLSTLCESPAAGGTKLRHASTQSREGAKGKQERTRGRASISSSWKTANSPSPMHGATKRGQSERGHAEEAVRPGVTSSTPADAGDGRRGGGDTRRKPRGFTKTPNVGDRVASAKFRKTVGGWRREKGGHWVASAGSVTARPPAGEAHVRECGLRSTHFAPGYLGVAWPDPLDSGAAAQDSAEAYERILARLEDAASRKLCEVEERTQRARRELADRRKRRNLLLEQNTRDEIQKAMEMQGRRLQRQLEAAKRRQAGAQAAADAAAVAAATRHSAGEMHVNARETTRDPGGANPARRVDRALAVRRRRAMLQGEMVRLTIEALKRKGERRAQSLLQEIGNAPRSDGAAGGKVHASGAAAAILASASITEGVGSRAMGKAAAGKGAVLGGGPPRSMESWSQQRRAKAEELRVSLAAEEAFETLKGVAELRRQNAVGERRDRARESNGRADEGHGRACKRARMQVESKTARLVARAREAQWAAAMFAAESAKKPTRTRAQANMRGRSTNGALRPGRIGSLRTRSHDVRTFTSPIGRESSGRSTKVQHERGRERSRQEQDRDDTRPSSPAADGTSSFPPSAPEVLLGYHGGRGENHATERRERECAAGATESRNHDSRQSQLLVEVLDEQKAIIDDVYDYDASGVAGVASVGLGPEGEDDCRRDTEKSAGGGRRKQRNKVWALSGADVDESTALERRLQHLDDLTARLEETEVGLAAKLDRFGLNGVARTMRSDGSGGRRRRFARAPAPGVSGSAGRGRFGDELSPRRRPIKSVAGRHRGSNASRALGRLAASTISSTLKAKPAPGVDAAGRGGNGKFASKSPVRRRKGDSSRLPKGSCNRSNNNYYSARHLGKDDTVGGGDRVDGRATTREERSTRVRRRAIAKDKRRVDDTGRREGAVPSMDDPQHCSDRSGAEITLRSADRSQSPSTGGGYSETKHDADGILRKSDQEKKDSVWSARAGNSLDEVRTSDERGGSDEAERVGISSGRISTRKAAGSNRHAKNGSHHEHPVLRGQHDDGEADTYRQSAGSNGGSRVHTNSRGDSKAYYESGGHKQALESVSEEAFRMREIKDDLTAALRRLQESDRLAAAVDPPEQRFVRDGIDCDTKGGGGDDDDEAATLASAFYGEDVVPKGKESGAVSRRQQEEVQPTTAAVAVSLQASALADLEARIASLGGLLSGYASGLSSPTQSPAPESPRSLRSPSLSPSSSPQLINRPFDSPNSTAENPRNNRGVHANRTVKDDDWRRNQAAAEKNSQYNGGGDGDGSVNGSDKYGKDALRDNPSTRAVSCSASSSAGWASSGSADYGPASATASAASALAREVEALLQSGGGGIETGDYGGTGLGDERRVIRSSGGGWDCGEVGQKAFIGGYSEKMGDSGWATLEGMAERLGALAGDYGEVFSATSVGASGATARGGSVYSSSRGVASVSSVGSPGPDVGRSVVV